MKVFGNCLIATWIATILVITARGTEAKNFVDGTRVCRPEARHAPSLRRHTGIPSLAVSPKNGRLWVTFYGGEAPDEDATSYVPLMTSTDGGNTWETVLIAEPTPGRRVFDPELWIAPDGRMHWSLTSRACLPHTNDLPVPYGGDHGSAESDCLMMTELDAENAPNAIPAFRKIADGVMMCKPIVLRDGTWLLPVAHWFKEPSACFYGSTDGGQSYLLRGGVSHYPPENRLFDEHTVVACKNGDLLSFIRARGGKHPSYLESVSHDNGKTWSVGKKARFKNTSSRHFLRRLKSGNLLLVKNGPIDKDVGRSAMTAFLSQDDGETWQGGLVLDARDAVSYPDGDQAADGTIYLTYDRKRFYVQEILLAGITEADILAGKLTQPNAFLRRTVMQLTDNASSIVNIGMQRQTFTDNHLIATATGLRRSPNGISAEKRGVLITKPLTFSGGRLFVDTACQPGGFVHAEILDTEGNVLKGFAVRDCAAIAQGAATTSELVFKGGDLAPLGTRKIRIRFILQRASLSAFWMAAAAHDAYILHVSPQGDDANAGTAAQPLRTPRGARDRLRQLRANGSLADRQIVVSLADGAYPLDQPLELDASDSGTASSPIVWRAANTGRAKLSGGVTLNDFHRVTDAATLAKLPAAARGNVWAGTLPGDERLPSFFGGGEETAGRQKDDPVQLYQDGERLPCARWPNDGYAQVDKPLDGGTNGCFRFPSPRLAAWVQEKDLWTYGLWRVEWDDIREPVKAIDLAAQTITIDTNAMRWGMVAGANFYVFNALSELDVPGEWVVDRATRRMLVWPRGNTPVQYPAIKHIIVATGVSHVRFEGFDFAAARGDALALKETTNVTVSASTLHNIGGWAVRVDGGANCRVAGCDIYDIGKGGVRLLGGNLKTVVPARHVADNCHIHHYGRICPNYHSGVYLDGVGNAATHNLIHDSAHQAIFFNGNDHYIGYNIMHDICQFNDDAGAVYACGQRLGWTSRGTIIEHNLIHHVGKKRYTKNTDAIYMDDWTSGVTIRGNVINRASRGGHFGGGNFLAVSNNLFIGCTANVLLGSRGIDSFAAKHIKDGKKCGHYRKLIAAWNTPEWRARYPEVARMLAIEDGVFAANPLFNRIQDNAVIASGSPNVGKAAKLAGTDNIVTNNPTFAADDLTDYMRLNFAPKAGTRLAAFFAACPLRLDEMGLYAAGDRASPAVRYGPDVARPTHPPRPTMGFPAVRIDIVLQGKLPAGETHMADDLESCEEPAWAKGNRVCTEHTMKKPSLTQWQDYAFSFTPRFDCRVVVDIMGSYGDKTLYDEIEMNGATLEDGSFERGEHSAWHLSAAPDPTLSSVQPPWGILKSAPEHPSAAGEYVAYCNHDRQLVQTVTLKKGVRVSLRFKARAINNE